MCFGAEAGPRLCGRKAPCSTALPSAGTWFVADSPLEGTGLRGLGQAIGGMVVQGLGGAFLEHLVYDASGQLLAGNLSDYLIPTKGKGRKRRTPLVN